MSILFWQDLEEQQRLTVLEVSEIDCNVKVVRDTQPWPTGLPVRRAGVSSFGYGGTNGHVVVESVDSLYPWYQHAKPKTEAKYNHSSAKPFLLTFSAHDKATLARNIQAHRNVASNYYAADLAHTLNLHRTKFSHRAFTILREGHEAENFSSASIKNGSISQKRGIAYLFTGQGVCI